jgi:hypothetical protein
MNLPWPSFWQHIREEDRSALREVLAELLSTGILLGDEGRARQLYLTARDYQKELAEYFAPLDLDLLADPDKPILQVRPIPGECGLTARFTKDETLLVLALWRIYYDERLERPVETVIISANDIFAKLKLYFEHIEPPKESHMERLLARLRGRRLIRFRKHEDPQRFGESSVEILPTLQRVIPFENAEAWRQQAELYAAPRTDGEGEEEP